MKFANCLIVLLSLAFIASAAHAAAAITLYADINAGPFDPLNVGERFQTMQGARDSNIGIYATGLQGDTNYFIMVVPDSGNPVVISDVGVGATLAAAGVTGTKIFEGQTCLGSSCAIIQTWHTEEVNDANFDVNFHIPTSVESNQDLNIVIMKANTVAGVHAASYTNINDANATKYFIVTPAILLYGSNGKGIKLSARNPKIMWNMGDWNMVTVKGFGMPRSDVNYQIKWHDANYAGFGKLVDLNVLDVNYGYDNTPGSVRRVSDKVYLSSPRVYDNNNSVDINKLNQGSTNGALFLTDLNGFKFAPDANRGNFDINIILPATLSVGVDNNIVVRAINEAGNPAFGLDLNSTIIISPNANMASDENVTVLISSAQGSCLAGRRYSVPYAMQNYCIADMNNVSNIQVEFSDGKGGIFAKVVMLSAVNLSRGPSRNYDKGMERAEGKAGFDISQMPEFNIDANITMYNVQAYSTAMPRVSRDGKPCPTAMCTYLTWAINTATAVPTEGIVGDGNLTFRVKNFSTYTVESLSGAITAPNGFEQIRQKNTSTADTNYTISFTFTDDKNYYATTPTYDINIYITDSNSGKADKNYLLVRDTNIFDSSGSKGHGLLCNNDSNFMVDINLQKTVTCTFDWNVTAAYTNDGEVFNAFTPGVFTPIGEWKVQVVLRKSDGNVMTMYSDNNFTLNAPFVKLVDANLNVQYSSWDSRAGYNNKAARDANKTIDFNVFIPDANALDKYSLTLWLSSTPTLSRGSAIAVRDTNHFPIAEGFGEATIKDSNLANFCQGHGGGWSISKFTNAKDYNCQVKLNTAQYPEGSWYVIIDVNRNKAAGSNIGAGGMDYNASPYALKINDTNVPTVVFSTPASGARYANGTTQITATTAGTDDSGRIKGYYFWKDTETTKTWVPETTFRNTSGSYQFTALAEGSHTLYAMAVDWSDNNSSANSVGMSIDTTGGGQTTPPSEGGAGGGSGTPTEGSQTILSRSNSEKPTAEEIRSLLEKAGASENAIEKASEAVGKTTVTREVNVVKTTSSSGVVTYTSTVTFTVTNPNSTKVLKKVKVLVEVPKTVALSASELNIPAGVNYRIVQADPIIEFELDEIAAGGRATLSYSVGKRLSDTTVSAMQQAVVAEFEEAAVDLCATMNCNDNNPCTDDSCSGGVCSNFEAEDGTSCGTGKECKAGACVAKPAPPAQPPEETPEQPLAEQPAETPWALILIVLILIVGGAWLLLRGGKGKKNKLTYTGK